MPARLFVNPRLKTILISQAVLLLAILLWLTRFHLGATLMYFTIIALPLVLAMWGSRGCYEEQAGDSGREEAPTSPLLVLTIVGICLALIAAVSWTPLAVFVIPIMMICVTVVRPGVLAVILLFAPLLAMAGCGLIWLARKRRNRRPGWARGMFKALMIVQIFAFLKGMPLIERWCRLEWAGAMPRNASITSPDWDAAALTTWWGRPLDPEKFWANRTVWQDRSALDEAKRHGRAYPPIPTHIPSLMAGFHFRGVPQRDQVPDAWSGGLDSGPVLPLHATEDERDYWYWFSQRQPEPPDQIDLVLSSHIWRTHRSLDDKDPAAARARRRLDEMEFRDARAFNFPPEALTEEALFWIQVMKYRREYSEAMASGPWRQNVLRQSGVDMKYITEPLTPEQLKAASAWKVAYLQRLRREHVDESYIAAYLQAWKLPAADVFATNQQP